MNEDVNFRLKIGGRSNEMLVFRRVLATKFTDPFSPIIMEERKMTLF